MGYWSRLLTVLLIASNALHAEQSAPASNKAPVLARLTFEVLPAKMNEVIKLYTEEFRPAMAELGLRESALPGRPTVDGFYCRLFEFDSIDDFEAGREKLFALADATSADEKEHFASIAKRFHFDLYEAALPEPSRQPAGAGSHRWRSFDADDGLLHSSLAGGVTQLADGSIWVGDDIGQWTRFDGRQWQAADICGVPGPVTLVLQDTAGNLWCARRGPWDASKPADLIRYDGRTATVVADSVRARNLAIEDHDGILWFGNARGSAFLWDRKGNRQAPQPEDIHSDRENSIEVRPLLVDRDGRVWASVWTETHGDQLLSHHKGRTQLLPRDGEIAPDAWFKSAAQDAEGRIWFGSDDGLWSHMDGVFRQEPINFLGGSLLFDRRGDLWFENGSNWNAGVARWEPHAGSGGRVTPFTTLKGLAGNSINGFVEDTEGGIWVATNAGASRMEPSLTTFRTTDGLFSNEPVMLALDKDGRLYYTARGDGFGVFDGGQFLHYAGAAVNAPSIEITSSGDTWLGATTSGANSTVRWRGDRLSYYGIADGLSQRTNPVGQVIEGGAGEIWFPHERLGRTDSNRFHEDSLAVRRIAVRRDGGLWLSLVDSGGFYRYVDGDTVRLDTDGALDGANVWDIIEDRSGDVWISSYGQGAVRYDGERFTTFGTDDGLVSPMLLSSFQDSEGHLWFGTDGGGAIRYDGTTFQSLTKEDGLAGNVVRNIIEDHDGNIWFACSGGLTRYTPSQPTQPPVFIDAVVADRRYEPSEEASVPSSAELISFEFHGMSMKTRPGAMVYRYRLVGHDDNWQQTGEERIEYTALPSGDYTFEVIAVDRDLGYSESPATLRLRVHPPYAEVALGAALVIALGLVGFQTRRVVRRDRRLIAANAELEAANEQITEATRNKSQFLRRMSHDLRSPMNAIIGYSRLLRRRTADRLDEREQRNLENIETSSGNLLNLINDILDLSRIEAGHVAMNLQPVDVRVLANECADALESIVHENVVLHRDLDDVGVINSDPDRLRQIVMNLLGNATKFTDSGSITLSLKRVVDGMPSSGASSAQTVDIDEVTGSSPHFIELTIADTGIGIPEEDLPHIFDEFRQVERQGGEAAEGTGLGLAIAKKTVDLLGGQITATSKIGTGTTFTVSLKDTSP